MTGLYAFDRCEVRPAERQLLVDGTPARARRARVRPAGGADRAARARRREVRVVRCRLAGAGRRGEQPAGAGEQPAQAARTERDRDGAGARVSVRRAARRRTRRLARPAARAPVNPNNLPHLRTRFIGREAALADCANLLRETRLLTLSGIGGCGKTRLAQELAQRQLGAFPDGVWFVDLGPLQEARARVRRRSRRRWAFGMPRGAARPADRPPQGAAHADRAGQLRARHRRGGRSRSRRCWRTAVR